MRHPSLPTQPLAAATVMLVALWTLSCSAPQPLAEPDLLAAANFHFEDRNFPVAVAQYRKLLDEHPFSGQSERASLRIAHAHYLNRDYDKALVAFNDFERLYPTSRELPFVEYTTGMCHLDRALMAERDPSAVERALRQFERLARRHSRSLYARLAAYRISECKERLARHELRIGEFYLDSDQPEAAQARLRYIVEQYTDTDTARHAASLINQTRD